MPKKWLILGRKVLVSGGLIWFALSRVDFAEAMGRIRQADPLLLVIAVGVIGLQAFIGGWRWRSVSMAIGQPLRYFSALRFFYIGMFFNQALPGGTGGGPVRGYLAYKAGLGLRGAINGVMLERMVTVVALVVLVDVTQVSFLPKLDEVTRHIFLLSVVLVSVGAVVGLFVIIMLERLPERLRHWKIVRGLSYLGNDARAVFLNPKNLAKALSIGLITHLNISLYVFVLSRAVQMDVSWLDCLVLVPPVLLITTIPISVGGWGVRENAMIVAFGLIGVPEASALALSVLFGLLGLAVSLPGGLVWFYGREHQQGLTLDTVEEEMAASAARDD